MTPEALLARTAGGSVPAFFMPPGGTPFWTSAECAMAARGVPQKYWYALRFSFAGDDSVRPALRDWLLEWALEHRRRWSFRLQAPKTGAQNIAHLVELHFNEERHPSLFRSIKEIYSIVLMVDEELWHKHLRPAFEDIRLQYLNWVACGLHVMRQSLQDDGGSPP